MPKIQFPIFAKNPVSDFCQKIELRKGNFTSKSENWSKIGILVKHRKIGQKSENWSKIGKLAKKQNIFQKIGTNWSKIEKCIKNRRIFQKWKCRKFVTIEILRRYLKL